VRSASESRRNAGFTLIETIVALGIIGVATYISISLYTGSLELGQSVRLYTVAADAADEYLAELVRDPSNFTWPDANQAQAGEVLPVTAKSETYILQPPATLPTQRAMGEREKRFYRKLTRHAFVRVPKADSPYVELIAMVSWVESGRNYDFTLTTLAPRGILETSP
jgi:prepilin-type N-terminal cleavage/methylation domain-containing protein